VRRIACIVYLKRWLEIRNKVNPKPNKCAYGEQYRGPTWFAGITARIMVRSLCRYKSMSSSTSRITERSCPAVVVRTMPGKSINVKSGTSGDATWITIESYAPHKNKGATNEEAVSSRYSQVPHEAKVSGSLPG